MTAMLVAPLAERATNVWRRMVGEEWLVWLPASAGRLRPAQLADLAKMMLEVQDVVVHEVFERRWLIRRDRAIREAVEVVAPRHVTDVGRHRRHDPGEMPVVVGPQ